MLETVKLSSLVTCIVERDRSRWSLIWASDGKTPRDFSAESLTKALDEASSQTAALYANHIESVAAELQFAIYPWEGRPGDVILDITKQGGEIKASDIQGSGITFTAPTFEGLIEGAERYVPDTTKAMFRWIRRVGDLA